ncbi:MAG: PIN domain-containing protein [Candidatus Edwardsbacteria bacterium]|nr:PIN domain-containing protein [Candidatus Edwardsbacteria bacterium]
MEPHLLDSDVLIEFLRGNRVVRDRLQELLPNAHLLCSAVSVAEVLGGVKPGEEPATRRLLQSLEIVPVDQPVAAIAAALRQAARLRVPLDDCLIAASALSQGAVLVTGNSRHYPFPELKGSIIDFRKL